MNMSVRIGLVVAGVFSILVSSASACTDQAEPLASPATGVELRFAPTGAGRVWLEAPQVLPDGSLRSPRLLPAATDIAAGKFDALGGRVLFLESDGKGGKRLCRSETWESRIYDPRAAEMPDGSPGKWQSDAGQVQAVAYQPGGAQERNKVLAKLAPHYFLRSAETYSYDRAGHLVAVRRHGSPEINSVKHHSAAKVVTEEVAYCLNYQDERLMQTAGFEHADGFVSRVPGFDCHRLQDAHVAVTDYRYNSDGSVLAELRAKGRTEEDAARSSSPGTGELRAAISGEGAVWLAPIVGGGPRPRVLIQFSSIHGLSELSTEEVDAFQRDAQPLYEERSQGGGALVYRFPSQPVPLTVIDTRFATLGSYARIRTYPHRSGLQISEVFNADKRTPRQRQWRGLDLSRQEMFDSSGRLTRVIHYGAAPRDAYKDDLRAYAERGVLRLTPTTTGYASYRVYDYDAKGKESLAFVCWQHDGPSNKPLRHFPWWTPDPTPKRGKEEALIYGMKNVANRCGTPDGTMVVQGLAQIDAYMAKTYGYDVEKLSTDDVR